MRIDHQLVEQWIEPNSRVLDLGCGDGTLLEHLQKHLGVTGYGLEIDEYKINQAIAKGLNIIEQNLNDGLAPLLIIALIRSSWLVHYRQSRPQTSY